MTEENKQDEIEEAFEETIIINAGYNIRYTMLFVRA